jgi:hypothetical protein
LLGVAAQTLNRTQLTQQTLVRRASSFASATQDESLRNRDNLDSGCCTELYYHPTLLAFCLYLIAQFSAHEQTINCVEGLRGVIGYMSKIIKILKD